MKMVLCQQWWRNRDYFLAHWVWVWSHFLEISKFPNFKNLKIFWQILECHSKFKFQSFFWRLKKFSVAHFFNSFFLKKKNFKTSPISMAHFKNVSNLETNVTFQLPWRGETRGPSSNSICTFLQFIFITF